QMQARPDRRVERGCEPVAGFYGRHESFLIGKYGFQPQLADQRVAGREPMVERTLWSAQALRDRINRHCTRAAFTGQLASRREEARVIVEWSSHCSRL